MRQCFFFLCFIVAVQSSSSQTVGIPSFAEYGVYDTDGIKPEEYRQRRIAVMTKMDSGAVAIFRANTSERRNGDTDYKFRQSDNFLYLTGCEESNCTLILVPEGAHIDSTRWATEILIVPPQRKSWAGDNLGTEGVKEVLGFGVPGTTGIALTTDKLKDVLTRLFPSKKILYYTPSLPDILFDPVSDRKFVTVLEVKKGIAEKYPSLTLKGSGILLNDLRLVKSPAELLLMQHAIDVTVAAQIEAAKSCEPEMFEYELQAVIEYCYTRSGCEYYGFPSIVGSGPNTMSFHYEANRRQMKKGELVVMDIGAEYHGYSADVTRTIPVNGTFSEEQKQIYDIVMQAQDSSYAEIKPGALLSSAGKRAMEVIGNGLVKLGIIKEKSEAKKYCPHGVSHSLGLNTHDVGTKNTLVPGMVFTMEPGIYIPDSSSCDRRYWGIGIRIEDDVLVTEGGCRVLSAAAPRATAEIEKLMKQKGIGNLEVGKK
jgi:Xaa-Pro aminopeptidase